MVWIPLTVVILARSMTQYPGMTRSPTTTRDAHLRRTFDEGIKRRDELIAQLMSEVDTLSACYKELTLELHDLQTRLDTPKREQRTTERKIKEKENLLDAAARRLQRSRDERGSRRTAKPLPAEAPVKIPDWNTQSQQPRYSDSESEIALDETHITSGAESDE